MTDKFGLVCEEALRFKDHKDVLVRKTVIQLIPVFASYDPLTFSQYYLHTCMQHLIIQLKKGDKDAGIFPSPFLNASYLQFTSFYLHW